MYFRVLLEGKNFTIFENGFPRSMGFFTTRFIRAEDEEKARILAIEKLNKEEKVLAMLEGEKKSEIAIEKITQINWFRFFLKKNNMGFAFYEHG